MKQLYCKFLNSISLWAVCYLIIPLCNISLFGDAPATTQPERIIRFIESQPEMPIARVGGGVRSTGTKDIVFTVLAPERPGLTTQAQPTLYWYQSKPAKDMEFELTLNLGDETLLEVRLNQAPHAGVMGLDLAALNISLEPDTSYEWVVALVPDPDDPEQDIISSTFIQRITLTDDLNVKLERTRPADYPYTYAEAGIWYDALKSIEQAIKAAPDNIRLKSDRLQLFEQVSLQNVVELEQNKLKIHKTLP